MENKVKIHILKCGEVGVDPAVPFRDSSKNPIAYTGIGRSSKHRIWLPVFAYLIQHPVHGNVLIDTGWHSDVRENQIKHMSLRLYYASKAKLEEGLAVDEQLRKLGVEPKELKYVFLSHLDVDHISGVELVKDAQNIMVSKPELQGVKKDWIRYQEKLWKDVNLKSYDFEESKYGPFNKAFDVFKDQSVMLIHVDGHTAGSAVTLVQNNGKFVLITGDCGYAKSSWEEIRLPGPVSDKEKMIKCLKWVKEMANKKECISVLASHDTEVVPGTIEI